MTARVAFLHTSAVHVETFDALARTAYPGVELAHVVAEDLLADAQRVGPRDQQLTRRVQQAMRDAADAGASVVVCTCSSIGGMAERTETHGRYAATRIDRAMADRAVLLGPRVLVVAALATTVGPTTELIHESAAALDRPVDLRTLVVDDAWPHFARGDRERYLHVVAQAVRAAAQDVDVVVLAQASMAPAATALHDLGIEVLSSPTLGVAAIATHLRR